MIYLVAIVFPLICIVCGIVVFYYLIRFIIEIQQDIRNHRT